MAAAHALAYAARTLPLAAALLCALATGAAPAAAQRIAAAPARAVEDAARPPVADAWLGEDKVRHFAASAAATALAYGGARIALDQESARGVAIGAAAVAGLLKEMADSRRTFFSARDLVWDALGIAAGYFWIREIE